MIKQNPSLYNIENYEMHLSAHYPEELVELYANAIVQEMKDHTGRSHYQTACKFLRRMIKLGGRETVDRLIAGFRVQYAQRKALMEELNRV